MDQQLFLLFILLVIIYMITTSQENFTQEEEAIFTQLISEKKLNPNASIQQKQLALRLYKK